MKIPERGQSSKQLDHREPPQFEWAPHKACAKESRSEREPAQTVRSFG